jgi:hypothetical protein
MHAIETARVIESIESIVFAATMPGIWKASLTKNEIAYTCLSLLPPPPPPPHVLPGILMPNSTRLDSQARPLQ